MSKVAERAVAEQLNSHLSDSKLLPRNESAYRKHHSTERALLRVTAADSRRVTLVKQIDLSAAFDCVDHDILLERSWVSFGVDNIVLRWIRCYLSDRTQQIANDGQLSALQPVPLRLPTGLGVRTATVRAVHG